MDDIITGPDLPLKGPVEVAKRKEGPAGSKNIRDPSAFEVVIGKKCRICKQAGHNGRTAKASRYLIKFAYQINL